jgi:ABC-type Mn2+/Zn2+ transport system permease subunit
MQIPVEWYNYILPGIVLISCSILILPVATLREYGTEMKNQLLGSAVMIGIASYLVGFLANQVILQLLKPITDYWGWTTTFAGANLDNWIFIYRKAGPELINELKGGYQGLVFNRLMFGAFIVMSVSSLMGIIWRKNNFKLRCGMMLACLLLTFVLYRTWSVHRDSYHNFLTRSVSAITWE